MIIATAGHVDHGKTSLVRHLTGVDTDRLEEEKRRGLSISLGYAYWQPADNVSVGFIDVPGHTRFINNMISGISGIDVGMLVVAADDGVMPQTREHVDVMHLLGVGRYVLVISKCDRVDAERVASVTDDAARLLPEGSSVYAISNSTGDGIDALREGIGEMAREWSDREVGGAFRMSIDRAFNLQGHGLTVTGTVASGSVSVGDSVALEPQKGALRVRSIHAQDAASETGVAGQRCAINVSGDLHKDDIERGDWLCGAGSISTTTRLDARVTLLRDAAFGLKNASIVKLHIGAKQIDARLILLKSDGSSDRQIAPGDSALAQIVIERPVLCYRGDRFLIRDYGETATLGGGVVFDPIGAEKRRASPERLAYLTAMGHDRIDDAIRSALEVDDAVLDYEALLKAWNLEPGKRPGRLIRGIARIDTTDGQLWLSQTRWTAILQSILDALATFHREQPDNAGIEQGMLARLVLKTCDPRLFNPALAELEAAGDIRLSGGLVAASSFSVARPSENDAEWAAVADMLAQGGLQIPGLAQLRDECGLTPSALDEILNNARRDGRVVRINAERYADTETVSTFARAVLALTEGRKPLTVAACRDHLGCGRNVLIEVLEYFDSIGFTRRMGNTRIVLKRDLPSNHFGIAASDQVTQVTKRKSDVPGGAPGLQNQ